MGDELAARPVHQMKYSPVGKIPILTASGACGLPAEHGLQVRFCIGQLVIALYIRLVTSPDQHRPLPQRLLPTFPVSIAMEGIKQGRNGLQWIHHGYGSSKILYEHGGGDVALRILDFRSLLCKILPPSPLRPEVHRAVRVLTGQHFIQASQSMANPNLPWDHNRHPRKLDTSACDTRWGALISFRLREAPRMNFRFAPTSSRAPANGDDRCRRYDE